MTAKLKLLMLCMIGIALPVDSLRADASISISGTVKRAVPICTVNTQNHIVVDFGDKIVKKKIQQQIYKEKIPIEVNCSDFIQNNMTLSIQGDSAGFNGDYIKTSMTGLGIQLFNNSTPIKQGDTVKFIYSNNTPSGGAPDIYSMLVSSTDDSDIIDAGVFTGSANIIIHYQ
ncbi:fimbrial protein [Enterobacter sp. CC120223-11]|uniref:fimbrial protein n=1 Tax=Enterobacter sp. CC120223-11 TaxID=1378073 RepID=UPI000BCBBB74|nr:fimbrial protein [Enterobacter sp. CC120223-11]SNY69829.1 Pilin (type 1 fimbria component protein) [Enterobacter sp. CC120223-11]